MRGARRFLEGRAGFSADAADNSARGAGGLASDPDLLAFRAYVAGGPAALTDEQRSRLRPAVEERGQSVGSNPQGGFLAPPQFIAELIRSAAPTSPMLDPETGVRFLITRGGSPLSMPTLNDTANMGRLIGENQQAGAAELSFGTVTLGAYKYTSDVVLISSELIEDAELDVEAEVANALASRLGRIANLHLTTGDGASKPFGVLNGVSTISAGSPSAIAGDDLINLEHAVDPAYRRLPSARFMFNDATLKAIRKLKDGQGNYLWQPANIETGAPSTVLGYRYVINQSMSDIGSGNKSVLFGAMEKYAVRIVRDIAIRRLDERYADFDQVGVLGFMRIDGEVLDTGAFRALLH